MLRIFLGKLIAINFKKLVNKLHGMGVFEVLDYRKSNLKGVNIIRGNNCSINYSAVLDTKVKGKITLQGNNYIGINAELGTNRHIKIGYRTSIQDRCILLEDIEIGNYCLFAPNVYLSSGLGHYYNYNDNPNFYIRDQDFIAHTEDPDKHSRKIVIEDDCWIGINSVVMPGVKISRGSIIGSNSVVTKDVEPFSIMVGIPAKLLKKRLEFTTKLYLRFDIDNDLPNFYKGFYLDMKNIQGDRKSGGISTSNCFTFYLDERAEKIRLRIKNISNKPLRIAYNKQSIALLSSEFEEITFKAIHTVKFHEFLIEGESDTYGEKYTLISEVKMVK